MLLALLICSDNTRPRRDGRLNSGMPQESESLPRGMVRRHNAREEHRLFSDGEQTAMTVQLRRSNSPARRELARYAYESRKGKTLPGGGDAIAVRLPHCKFLALRRVLLRPCSRSVWQGKRV